MNENEKMCSTREGKKSVVTNASALGGKKSKFSGGKEAGIEQKALMKKTVGTFAHEGRENVTFVTISLQSREMKKNIYLIFILLTLGRSRKLLGQGQKIFLFFRKRQQK